MILSDSARSHLVLFKPSNLYASALEGGEDIIFAVDASGRISMFKWSAKPDHGMQDVQSFRRFDSVPDNTSIGSITELAVHPYVLVRKRAQELS